MRISLTELRTGTRSEIFRKMALTFLRRGTVRIGTEVVADYCPYEGLRFQRGDKDFFAIVDGLYVADPFQAAMDLVEYVLGGGIFDRPGPPGRLGRIGDATHKNSIPANF